MVLTGGGTGGHLNIIKCLLESASRKGLECVYIGSENGQDRLWFDNEKGFREKFFLSSRGVMNQSGMGKFHALAHIFKLSKQCQQIFSAHGVKAVFSVGGYSGAPASFAALFSRLPLLIHEQNAKRGGLNSLLKPFARGFFSAFEKEFAPYPVRDGFFDLARRREGLGCIIFLGGSQGASFINDLALNLAPKLDQMGVKIIHQCGGKDLQKCQEAYEALGISAEVFDFCPHLEEKMHRADLAISRAGASTLFELCANALPCIFIPYPYAAKNHQFFNAKFLHDRALCQIFTQEQASAEDVFKAIASINLPHISQNLEGIAQKNAAEFLLQKALKLF